MERKQNNNQTPQSSNNHSNDSNSSPQSSNNNSNNNSNDSNSSNNSFDSNSSSSSNYDYISLYMKKKRPDFEGGGGGDRGLLGSSPPLLQSPNPGYMLQNTMLGLNRLSINGGASAFNRTGAGPSNNFVIGGNRPQSVIGGRDWNNRVQHGMAKIEITENVLARCDFVSKCAMTSGGCDELQKMLAAEGGRMREAIITKVTADLPVLMVHQIGFQVAKAVFKSCDIQQMSRVLQSVVVGNELAFVYICNEYFGRESVKALIQNLKIESHFLTVACVLEDYICSFTNYKHGQHVLEFFFYTCFKNDFYISRLFNAMTRNCVEIATNRFGCSVLQHCICPMFLQSSSMPNLLDKIITNSLLLAEDKYGNYVIQHVVQACIEDVTRCIVGRLEGAMCGLAKSKCGSNVVEMCLQMGEQREVVKIVVELSSNSDEIVSMAQSPFGNYVIQCALEQAHIRGTEELYNHLVKAINVHATALQTHLYGRTVIQKIHKLNYNLPYKKLFYSAK